MDIKKPCIFARGHYTYYFILFNWRATLNDEITPTFLSPLVLPLLRTRDPDAGGLASAPCPTDSPDAGGLAGAPCPVREGRADGPAAAGVAGAPSTAR